LVTEYVYKEDKRNILPVTTVYQSSSIAIKTLFKFKESLNPHIGETVGYNQCGIGHILMVYSAFDKYMVSNENKMGQCTDCLYTRTSTKPLIQLGETFRRAVTFSLNLAQPWTLLSIIKNIIKQILYSVDRASRFSSCE
jgi:hypothetical protein